MSGRCFCLNGHTWSDQGIGSAPTLYVYNWLWIQKELNNMNVKGQKKSWHYLLVVQLESPNKIVYNAISFPNNTCFNN